MSQHEAQALFQVIRDLRQRGVSIIYVSHRLAEVQDLADRVVVLRDGKNAGELGRADIRHDRMVSLMVGREVSLFAGRRPAHAWQDDALEVKELDHGSAILGTDLSFRRSRSRNRRHCGPGWRGADGTVTNAVSALNRHAVAPSMSTASWQPIRHPGTPSAAGLALVPEDRKQQGLILEMTVQQNIGLAALRRNARAGAFIDFKRERRDAAAR